MLMGGTVQRLLISEICLVNRHLAAPGEGAELTAAALYTPCHPPHVYYVLSTALAS